MIDSQFSSLATTHALEHYKNHCEFLGYSVEEIDEQAIVCRHARKDNVTLIVLTRSAGILAQTVYSLPNRWHSNLPKLYEFSNDLNKSFTFVKSCINTPDNLPPSLYLSSVYEGEYSRSAFSTFLENLNEDLVTMHSHPSSKALWSQPSTLP
jgi:hypothetical protein